MEDYQRVARNTIRDFIEFTPKIHIGIIPDGNRRWHKNQGMGADALRMIQALYHQYKQSLQRLLATPTKDVYEMQPTHMFRVGHVTLYLLSKDNLLKRNDGTLDMVKEALFHIHNDVMQDDCLFLDAYSIHFIGDLECLSSDMLQMCQKIESRANRGKFSLCIALAYDPVSDARKWLNGDPSRFQGQTPIDVVIRSGGEQRSSGFFPLHTLYSEWVYLTPLFPDLTMQDIHDAIADFLNRNRRFGS
jgi:undecaprenyl pyrophosphate synthase